MSAILNPLSTRRHLTPISPRKRTALSSLGSSFSNRQNQVLQQKIKSIDVKSTSSPKRPLATLDENAFSSSAFPKRFKSVTSCDKSNFVLVSTDENATAFNADCKPKTINNATSKSLLTSLSKKSDGGVVGRKKLTGGSSPIRDSIRGVKRTHGRFEERKVRKSAGIRRVDPPKKGSKDSNTPISIDQILGQTGTSSAKQLASSAKARNIVHPISRIASSTTSSKPLPESWHFQIHEDTEEETLTNIVDFHTGNLDISERRILSELELRGKENIPPSELLTLDPDSVAMPPPRRSTITETPSTSSKKLVDHKSAAADKPRTPLSAIPTSDLYPEGDKETPSVVIKTTTATTTPVTIIKKNTPISEKSSSLDPSYATVERPHLNPFAAVSDSITAFLESRENGRPSSAPSFSVEAESAAEKKDEVKIYENEEVKEEAVVTNGEEGVFTMEKENVKVEKKDIVMTEGEQES